MVFLGLVQGLGSDILYGGFCFCSHGLEGFRVSCLFLVGNKGIRSQYDPCIIYPLILNPIPSNISYNPYMIPI